MLPLIVVAVWERSGVICAPSHSGGCIMGEVGCDMWTSHSGGWWLYYGRGRV